MVTSRRLHAALLVFKNVCSRLIWFCKAAVGLNCFSRLSSLFREWKISLVGTKAFRQTLINHSLAAILCSCIIQQTALLLCTLPKQSTRVDEPNAAVRRLPAAVEAMVQVTKSCLTEVALALISTFSGCFQTQSKVPAPVKRMATAIEKMLSLSVSKPVLANSCDADDVSSLALKIGGV